MNSYADLAVQWMQEYLGIDTTNPPGNELRAAEMFRRIFRARRGSKTASSNTRRDEADVWAQNPAQRGDSAKRPIIRLNHMDVVTSDPTHWKVPPFSAQIVDGAIYGRGAEDMKNEGLAQLMVMVMLKREKVALDRDVIFLAVSRRRSRRHRN